MAKHQWSKMTFKKQQELTMFIDDIRKTLYLNNRYRLHLPANDYPPGITKKMKTLFFNIWKSHIMKRTSNLILQDKEKAFLDYCYKWSVCDPNFKGDVNKGLYIASKQGFGKDVMLKTISYFFEYFLYTFKRYTYFDFCDEWFNNDSYMFNSPTIITDVYDNGKMKREKESIPFLEFLDYREQTDNRRGIVVSTNYTPDALQELLEPDRQVKRLKERIKECFNIILIKDADSKRIEEIEII